MLAAISGWSNGNGIPDAAIDLESAVDVSVSRRVGSATSPLTVTVGLEREIVGNQVNQPQPEAKPTSTGNGYAN